MVKELLLKPQMTKIIQNQVDIYNLQKFKDQIKICINQKPLVRVGDKVKPNIIADGPSTKIDELALVKC